MRPRVSAFPVLFPDYPNQTGNSRLIHSQPSSAPPNLASFKVASRLSGGSALPRAAGLAMQSGPWTESKKTMGNNRIRRQSGTRWIERRITRNTAAYRAQAYNALVGSRPMASHISDAFVEDLMCELGLSQSIEIGRTNPQTAPVFSPNDSQARLRLISETRNGAAVTLDYGLVRYGVPVWGAHVSVTLPDGRTAPLEATFRLPVPLPAVLDAPAAGKWRPQLIDATRLAGHLGLRGHVGLTSKRLVLHRLDPQAIGPAGRLVNALAGGPGPLTTRSAIGRPARNGAFVLASEIAFDWAPPGGRRANWLVLIDASSGAVLHAERREVDILGAISLDEPRTPTADRRPAERPAGSGTVDWVDHLRMAAELSCGGKRGGA